MELPRVLLAGTAALCLAAGARAEDPVSNLDRIREVARAIGERARAGLRLPDSARVRVTVLPGDLAWTIGDGFAAAFGGRGGEGASHEVQGAFREASVDYGVPFREGLFGERRVLRTARLVLTVSCTADGESAPGYREDFADSLTDEIPATAIDRVEHPTLAFTRGRAAPEGFLSGLIEPLILIGALGVAVVLLFQVRS